MFLSKSRLFRDSNWTLKYASFRICFTHFEIALLTMTSYPRVLCGLNFENIIQGS